MWNFLFVYLVSHNAILLTISTFTEESGYLSNTLIRKEEHAKIINHLLYLASDHATTEEREELIQNGVTKSAEHFSWPIHENPSSRNGALDCKIRQLAFDFAKKLSVRGLKFIFDGLQLESLCHVKYNIPYEDQKRRKTADQFLQNNVDTIELFVDQANNNVEKDGSFERPFINIQPAVDHCVTNRMTENVACHVFIRSGTYHIDRPILIKNDNVKLIAYSNEEASVTSDVIVAPDWKLFKKSMDRFSGFNPLFEGIKPGQSTKSVVYFGLTNATVCEYVCKQRKECTAFAFFGVMTGAFKNQCFFRTDGRWNTIKTSGVISGKKVLIYSADLSKHNVKDVNSIFINNRRAIRARFPNANPETMGLHTTPTGYVNTAEKWLPPKKTSDALEILIAKPSRAKTLFSGYGLGFGGPVSQFEPPQSYWGTKNPVGGAGATYKLPSGLQYSKDLEINLRTWKNASTGIVHAFQYYHWANWIFKLDSRNAASKTLQWSYGGFQESRGSTVGKEWYVENILEELDVANEWFYDEKKKLLYFSPNTTADDLPTQLSIPQLASLIQIIGTQSKPVRNSHVYGLTLLHTTKTFLKPYNVPSGGDWSVHRNASLFIEGTENVTVDQCTFDSPEGNGIFVSNYNRETVISNNLFYRVGDNGIVLVGDSHMIDGTQGAQPRKVKVLSNTIFDIGLWGKQTCAFVQSRACESYLEGNVFFNGPRAGINLNDGFGGGNVFQKNLLFNFVRETSDHGPFNSWDRVPYLTKLANGKASLDVKINHINYNFIINYYRSEWPLDHDDGSCFWKDTHNYLVYGGFKNFLGHDKQSMNNIYVYPREYCVDTRAQSLGTSGYGDTYGNNICVINRPDLYRLGNCNVEHMRELIPLLMENHYYTPKGKFLAKCGSNVWTLEQFKMHGMDIDTVVEDLPSDDQVIQWGKDLFGL